MMSFSTLSQWFSTRVISPCPQGDIWQCLEVILIVTTSAMGPVSSERVESRHSTRHLAVTGQSSQQGLSHPALNAESEFLLTWLESSTAVSSVVKVQSRSGVPGDRSSSRSINRVQSPALHLTGYVTKCVCKNLGKLVNILYLCFLTCAMKIIQAPTLKGILRRKWSGAFGY